MEDSRKNPLFIINFNNDRHDDFIGHTQLLGTDTNPSKIWLHWERSLWAQLVWIRSVNFIPSPYEFAALLVATPLKIKDDTRH